MRLAPSISSESRGCRAPRKACRWSEAHLPASLTASKRTIERSVHIFHRANRSCLRQILTNIGGTTPFTAWRTSSRVFTVAVQFTEV